jgi:hypothetical protein
MKEDNTLYVSNLAEMISVINSLGKEPDHVRRAFVSLVHGLPSGCPCNRAQRKDQAVRGYCLIATSFDEDEQLKIKQVSEVEKVIVSFNGEVLNEF